jgi:pimeloyl-ACP methyl ester carboxylesterase
MDHRHGRRHGAGRLNPIATFPHATGSTPSADVQIFYLRFGRATGRAPLLVAHGLSYSSYDWIAIAAQLAQEREVVAFDLRGFGESTWSTERRYELQDLSGDIVTLLDHLGWDDAVLAGHSMGGRVCLVTVAWQPARVRALACLDFAPDVAAAGRRKVAERIGNQPDRFASVDAAMAYHGHHDVPADAPLRQRWQAFLREAPDGWILKRDLHFRDTFRQTLQAGKPAPSGVDLWAMVKELRMPALFVRGESSDMFAAETLDKLRAANPRLHLAQIAGGHALMDDNPAGVVKELQRFLADAVDA